MPGSRGVSVACASVRIAVPILVLAACALLLSRHVTHEVWVALPVQLAAISAGQWLLAALLTAGSFLAVAQYDVQAHRALGTSVSGPRARATGAVGIAIGQVVGFGLLSGALARWRMLPDLSLGQALKLSTFVSLSFVVAWVCLTGLISAVLPAPGWTLAPSIAVIVASPCLAALLFFRPKLRVAGRTIHLPSLGIAGAILVWALVDMVLAAAALWVLLPDGSLPFATLLPLFMIALGLGLISNTPGGVGPFELVLVSALANGADADVLAGILAFRVVYYAVPGALAVLAMLRPFSMPQHAAPPPQDWHALPRSEVLALRQNGGRVARMMRGVHVPLWRTAQTETLFTEPGGYVGWSTLTWTHDAARKNGRIALIYKMGARLAHTARRARWAVLHVADEAVLDLRRYDIDSPARSRLRRKLRAADKAAITLRSGTPPDVAAAAHVDAEWQARTGPARGGSVGRYCPTYVSDQWVVSAYSGDTLIAFASFHTGPSDWCLDLMRHRADMPDGTMHALVHRALLDAKAQGVRRASLASITACPDPSRAIWRWAAQKAVVAAGGTGLRQFKSAFAPRWVPRYAAAPNWFALALGLADIARSIRDPDPLPLIDTSAAHHKDENYELASRSAA